MLPAERAAAILSSVRAVSDAALERTFADPGHPALAHLAALVDDADSEDPALRQPALAALFGGLVEPLNDSFTAAGRAVYAELFTRAVWRCCAARVPLRAGLAEFGIHSQEQLLRRYREIRARSLAPITTPGGANPSRIAVLSRVTIGADILLTSVLLARLHQRWPLARLHLLGEAKLAGLFAGLPQVQVEALSYPRRGPLGERLQGWLAGRTIVRRIGADLVVAPDSRIDQLGILPLIGIDRYVLWENLLPTGQAENLARRLDHDLALRLDLPDAPVHPGLGLDAPTLEIAGTLAAALGPGPWAAVKLDHGGNPAKALPRQAEGMLMRELRKRGWRILLDRGFGDAELAGSDELLLAAGMQACDVDQDGPGLGLPLASLAPLALADEGVVRLHGSIAAWAAGVRHCSLAVSYDSVGHHLAAALGVPVVVAFTGFADAAFPIAWHPCGDSAVWVVEIPTAERGDPAHWFRFFERLPEAPQARGRVSVHVLYLHGFASSVRTAKGVALGQRLAANVLSYRIPDLEGGDFRALTMDGILERAQGAVDALPQDGRPLLVIGSSLGGYTAARIAARGSLGRAAALLLIAPAFGFPSAWRERLGEEAVARWRMDGERPFFHHASEREMPLGYGFLESCLALPDLPGEPGVATAIVHGRQDESVDCRRSVEFAQSRARVELHLVEGDHRLTEPRHEELLVWCARDLIAAF